MNKRTLTILLALVIIMGLLIPLPARAADIQAGMANTAGSALNVRSGASTGSTVLAKLQNGSYVTLHSRSGSWWRVEYAQGRFGYCHADYIKPLSGTAAQVATSGGNLNVRSGSGTSYAILDRLPKGETVIILSTSGSWSRILYHGNKTGFVSSQYLSAGAAYAPVSLSVPSFKQTDHRWANTPIGTSGKTMAQIGCATTAIAMMESYRTGGIITPDAMARKLRYTPTGSVYWPSHYTATADSPGYLKAVYQLLKAGKPVLFGAKNSHGGQHWVVITGFSGGNTLSPAGFTIHDPGSGSRTNLQQFLNVYPNFYKYFHY